MPAWIRSVKVPEWKRRKNDDVMEIAGVGGEWLEVKGGEKAGADFEVNSPSNRDEAIRLRSSGGSVHEIAQQTKINKQTLYRIFRNAGLGQERKVFTRADWKHWRARLKSGENVKQIATECGVTERSIAKGIKSVGGRHDGKGSLAKCDGCGSSFKRRVAGTRTCSRKCAHAAHYKKKCTAAYYAKIVKLRSQKHTCSECHKTYKAGRVMSPKRKAFFCSRNCAWVWHGRLKRAKRKATT